MKRRELRVSGRKGAAASDEGAWEKRGRDGQLLPPSRTSPASFSDQETQQRRHPESTTVATVEALESERRELKIEAGPSSSTHFFPLPCVAGGIPASPPSPPVISHSLSPSLSHCQTPSASSVLVHHHCAHFSSTTIAPPSVTSTVKFHHHSSRYC